MQLKITGLPYAGGSGTLDCTRSKDLGLPKTAEEKGSDG